METKLFMNHALITGGAGFIGSKLAIDLLAKDWKVTIVDNLSTGLSENIPLDANFINIDISHFGWTKKLPSDIDFIFHLAAQSSGEISFEDPSRDCSINVNGTLELLQWANSIDIKRFIFASSMNVYGKVRDQAINEKHKISPESFYGVGKAACENYIKLYSKLGLKTSIFRLFNVYGPGQNIANMKQGMLSIYCSYIWQNKPIIVKGSEERFRDFVYIDDVIKIFYLATRSTYQYEKLNLCYGRRVTVKEAIQTIKEVFKKPNHCHYVVDGTPGDQFGIYGDNSELMKIYKYAPDTTLLIGLQKMVTWLDTI